MKTIPTSFSKKDNSYIILQRRQFPNYFRKKTIPKLFSKEDNSQIIL